MRFIIPEVFAINGDRADDDAIFDRQPNLVTLIVQPARKFSQTAGDFTFKKCPKS